MRKSVIHIKDVIYPLFYNKITCICLIVTTSLYLIVFSAHVSVRVTDKSDRLNKARLMLTIGHGNSFSPNVSTRLLNLWKRKTKFTSETEDYSPFISYLPNILAKTSNDTITVTKETRLEQLNGYLPYLPCRIRLYTDEDLQECMQRRHTKPFWIAFIGDSKMRNKFVYLIENHVQLLKWEIYNYMGKQVSLVHDLKWFVRTIKENRTRNFQAVSPLGPKVTYIHSDHGTSTKDPFHFKVHPWLAEWNNTDSFPEVLVLEFGLWYMLRSGPYILRGINDIHKSWQQMSEILQALSKKMLVIVMATTRKRDSYTLQFKPRVLKELHKVTVDTQTLDRIFHHELLKQYSSDAVDRGVLSNLHGRDVIFWDSTLPFNLASGIECLELMDQKTGVIDKINENLFNELKCSDGVHRTHHTLKDESTMLFNILCNPYMESGRQNDYCY